MNDEQQQAYFADMDKQKGTNNMRKISFGSVKGGTGTTTCALAYAIHLAKIDKDEKILYVGALNQIQYFLDLAGVTLTSPTGNEYTRFSIGNIAFAPYSKRLAAISAENPTTLIRDIGLVLHHYQKDQGEELFYIHPTEDTVINEITKFRSIENGTEIRYPLALLHKAQSQVADMPLQSTKEFIELGDIIYKMVK